MVFVACGLNHKTAPIDVREKIALLPATQDILLDRLLKLPAVNEAAILSTCNRTEIYCDTSDPDVLPRWLAKENQLPENDLSPFCYLHQGHDGLKHTIRVASGLDSMMVGEPQILGQMKQAYQKAYELGAAKNKLRDVFEYVFSASKRVRTQSRIGEKPISVAYAAAQLVLKLFPNDQSLTVFLIGSGETASLVAKYLHQQGINKFLVASRTVANAALLAESLGGKSLAIGEIAKYFPQADVVISATTCPVPFINQELVAKAQTLRQHKPMCLLDLAVPRDIESNVKEIDNIFLYNVDDLQDTIQSGILKRQQQAIEAELIIEDELNSYIRNQRVHQATTLICDYREQMNALAQLEVQRTLKKLQSGNNQDEVLNEFSQRLINKLIHHPTTGLREIAKDDKTDLLSLFHYLYQPTSE